MLYLIGPDGLFNRGFVNFRKMVWITTVHVLRFRFTSMVWMAIIHTVYGNLHTLPQQGMQISLDLKGDLHLSNYFTTVMHRLSQAYRTF